MMRNKTIAILLATLLGAFGLCSCDLIGMNAPAEFSNYRAIAELATVECYYHNVAELYNPGTDYLFGVLNVGYKKAWFEYRGSVRLGIDVSKVSISSPDENGVVTVTMPAPQIIGAPEVDETSFSDALVDSGMLTKVTLEDKTNAFKEAQANMRNEAEGDSQLMQQAKDRAKTLLEQYIVNIGKSLGTKYTVKFVDV